LLVGLVAYLPGMREFGSKIGAEEFALPKELIFQCAAFTAAAVCLVGVRQWRLAAHDVCLIGFFALGAMSAVLAATNPHFASRSLALMTSGVLVFWLARHLAGIGLREGLLVVVTATAAVGALTIVAEAHGLIDDLSRHARAPGGTEGNRNYMAHLLALSVPLAGWQLFRACSRQVTLMLATHTILVFYAITLTRCRAAWLAVILSVVSLLLMMRGIPGVGRGRRAGLVGALCAGVALATLVPTQLAWRAKAPFISTIARIAEYEAGSGRGRLIQYKNTLQMIAGRPLLGVGPGNWSVDYPTVADRQDPTFHRASLVPVNRLPNSDWLGLAAENGVPAFALLLAAAFLVVRSSYADLRRNSDAQARARAATLLATFVALAALGALDAVLQRPMPAFATAIVVGALAPPAAIVWSVPCRLPVRVAAVAVASVIGIAFAIGSGERILAAGVRSTAMSTTAQVQAAMALDPGDYTVPAEQALLRRRAWRCDEAVSFAQIALSRYPHHVLAELVIRDCERVAPADRTARVELGGRTVQYRSPRVIRRVIRAPAPAP
jgi:O-antigen ligase